MFALNFCYLNLYALKFALFFYSICIKVSDTKYSKIIFLQIYFFENLDFKYYQNWKNSKRWNILLFWNKSKPEMKRKKYIVIY